MATRDGAGFAVRPARPRDRADVIGGLGAFVVVANETRGFTNTLLGKMIREIVDATPTGGGVDVVTLESKTE